MQTLRYGALILVLLVSLTLVVRGAPDASAAAVDPGDKPAYSTQFVTALTYFNRGTGPATIEFRLYNGKSSSYHTINRTLNTNAGSSLYIGSLQSEGLPKSFRGAATIVADQPVVTTLVQIPASSAVAARPLSNGTQIASSRIIFASVLKNYYGITSIFSVQNASTSNADFWVTLYNANDPSTPIVINTLNVPPGAAAYYDMGTLSEITAGTFTGSAIVEGKVSGTTTPAVVTGSVLELAVNNYTAKAFEAVTIGARTIYMATALCDPASAPGQQTAFGVTNTSQSTATRVTVTYSNNVVRWADVARGAKASFRTCDATGSGFSGTATVTSSATDIVVVGKKYRQNAAAVNIFEAAYMGEASGASTHILPYVRWATAENYARISQGGTGKGYQRTYIAVTNIGSSTVSNVAVRYYNVAGTLVGTHTITSIPARGKAVSTVANATGDATALANFGHPPSNPGGAYGGSAVVSGPSGSQLIAIVDVNSDTAQGDVIEEYNSFR